MKSADDQFSKVVTDSLWIIAFAKNGVLGLMAILGLYMLPSLGLWSRVRRVRDPTAACLLMTMGVLMALHSVDATVNAFAYSPILMGLGGLSGMLRTMAFPAAIAASVHPIAAERRITADPVLRPRPRARRPARF